MLPVITWNKRSSLGSGLASLSSVWVSFQAVKYNGAQFWFQAVQLFRVLWVITFGPDKTFFWKVGQLDWPMLFMNCERWTLSFKWEVFPFFSTFSKCWIWCLCNLQPHIFILETSSLWFDCIDELLLFRPWIGLWCFIFNRDSLRWPQTCACFSDVFMVGRVWRSRQLLCVCVSFFLCSTVTFLVLMNSRWTIIFKRSFFPLFEPHYFWMLPF